MGNTINVQGNYIDVHDNEVVNLNIDKATVMTEDVEEKASVLTDNEAFMGIMERAMAQGLCTRNGVLFQWSEKIDAVYFASVASHKFHLSRRHDSSGDLAIAWKPFEALFGEKNFRSKYNDYQQGKIKVHHKAEIDGLLK